MRHGSHLSRARRRGAGRLRGLAALLAGSIPVTGAFPPQSAMAAPPAPLWIEQSPRPARPAAGPPAFARLARGTGPAVVNISSTPAERAGPPSPVGRGTARSQGTGFLINRDGFILTNHHVVDGAADIHVRLADDREFTGRLVGSDAKTDIALLKIDTAGELVAAPLGDSDDIEIGEWVMAIGNPFGLDHTVTVGIVSGKGRRDVRPGGSGAGFYDFIQTDASINVGNSGGPLINAVGEVIGVNTAINAQGQGIAFAIPINMVKTILPSLRDQGRVARSWLGVTPQPLTQQLARAFGLPDTRGALLAEVAPGSPAETAGLQPGEVVIELDGHAVRRADDLTWLVSTAGAGRRVALSVRRGAATRRVNATLIEDPDDPPRAQPAAETPRASPLGMMVSELSAAQRDRGQRGVVVRTIEPGSPASEAGLERGDLLLQVGDAALDGLDDYRRVVGRLPQGALIRVLGRRDGRSFWAAFAKR
jgi:serine protease Do